VEPATKQDIRDAINELKLYIVERESAWIKWIIGIQISYFIITLSATLGATYFMLGKLTHG
jgi:hypothetical protein